MSVRVVREVFPFEVSAKHECKISEDVQEEVQHTLPRMLCSAPVFSMVLLLQSPCHTLSVNQSFFRVSISSFITILI